MLNMGIRREVTISSVLRDGRKPTKSKIYEKMIQFCCEIEQVRTERRPSNLTKRRRHYCLRPVVVKWWGQNLDYKNFKSEQETGS